MRDAAIDSPRASGRSTDRTRSGGAPLLDGLGDERPMSRRAKSGSTRVGGVMTSAAIAAQRLGGRRRGRTTPGFMTRLSARMPRIRPFKTLTITVFSVALVGIVANAMVFQRGRHPAPLFGLGQSVDGVPEGSQLAAAPLPVPPAPPAMERTGAIAPAPAPVAEPMPVPSEPKPPHRDASKPHPEDGAAAKVKVDRTATVAHPRPGHAPSKAVGKVDAKAQGKTDPVGRLLAEPAQKTNPKVKTARSKSEVDKAERDHHLNAEASGPVHGRRGLAAAVPADAGETVAGKTATGKTATGKTVAKSD